MSDFIKLLHLDNRVYAMKPLQLTADCIHTKGCVQSAFGTLAVSPFGMNSTGEPRARRAAKAGVGEWLFALPAYFAAGEGVGVLF